MSSGDEKTSIRVEGMRKREFFRGDFLTNQNNVGEEFITIHHPNLLSLNTSQLYQERVGITVVENVLEAIRVGMEINQPQYNQRRVAEAKLLGELYNYRMIESNIIFNTLYLVISFGSLPDATNPIDPPTDTIRIRLVLTIMDTCGQYFEKGNLKKKCDTFLLFFQKYLFTKVQPLPIDVDYSIQDTMEAIRPHMTLYSTVVEVDEAIAEISPQLRHVLGSQEVDDDDDDEDDEDTETEDAGDDGNSPTEDEEVKVKKLEVHKCEEDEEFLKELEKTMTAELSDRKTNMRVGSSDLALPMNRGFKGKLLCFVDAVIAI
eukprot:sb/3466916/